MKYLIRFVSTGWLTFRAVEPEKPPMPVKLLHKVGRPISRRRSNFIDDPDLIPSMVPGSRASAKEKNAHLPPGVTNDHPSVKPIRVLRWLVRLLSRPGATILDPFCGSGSTGVAAMIEGRQFVGVERDPKFVRLSKARLDGWSATPDDIADAKSAY
jgi:DNA modification methylase